jgi:putative glycosyltransferase (TIGR04372 family)
MLHIEFLMAKYIRFLIRQTIKFWEGRRLEKIRKLKLLSLFIARLPVQLIVLMPAFFVVLTVRLIRPVFLVRFQSLICWRIGHFAANVELYLCEFDAGINRPKTRVLDIWYYPCAPCNKQLARMWNRELYIGPEILFGMVERINGMIPGGDLHRISISFTDRDVHNLLDQYPPHLSFLPDEKRQGEMGLRSLGIPNEAPFVCLIVRDSTYLNDQSPHLDWSRHNYRDCNIQNYILAAQKLVERGYYVIRMGAVVGEVMDVDHPMIIDYATNSMRSDFMDIYLGAKCAFYISNGCGIDAIAYIFRKPIVYVDMAPMEYISTNSSKFISTTKDYWLRDESRYMTFHEIFESGAGTLQFSSEFEAMGIDLVESTPQEITAVVLEMEERLSGSWRSSQEDERLQQSFWEIFPKTNLHLHGKIKSRIGTEFLRQRRDYLN